MKNFLAGLGIGALIGVIMAPARGEETRAQLRDRAEKIGEQLGERIRDINESGEAAEGRGGETSSDTADVVGNMSRKAIDLQQSGEVKMA